MSHQPQADIVLIMARDAEADAAMPITVFVVDDDEAVRDSLKLLLESYGMTVEDYGSTEEFVRHYRPRGRQCLILDQHLPGTTGLDFLASPLGAALGLPVILITGRGDLAIRDRAFALEIAATSASPSIGGRI